MTPSAKTFLGVKSKNFQGSNKLWLRGSSARGFSTKSINLAKPRNWGKIDKFQEQSFNGGTDGEQMLAETIRVLQIGTFEMADVLIISDFEFPVPEKYTQDKIDKERTLGTRFYGLRIGQCGTKEYETNVLDKMWTV